MKKQTGKVNYVWVLAGGYLLYLAIKVVSVILRGDSDAPLVTLPFGIVYALVGAWLLRREWKAYRYGLAHKDDPDSWNEEDSAELPEEIEEEEQP